MDAYDDAFKNCHRDIAPWYIIPADDKSYRNLVICRVIVHALRQMAPKFPTPQDDLGHITIE